MKTLGLVGGTGWVSTVDYYRLINQEANRRLGGLNFCEMFIYSFNYAEINSRNKKDDHAAIFGMVKQAAQKLITAGAEGIVLCANTLHMYADDLQKEIDVPIIHIAEATAKEINSRNFSKAGLMGTKFTMEKDFYKTRLSNHGITPLVPEAEDREFINDTIFNELLKEIFKKETKEKFLEIIDKLKTRGAETIILGCTEIPLLIKEGDCDLPIINTLEIHSKAAVDFALS